MSELPQQAWQPRYADAVERALAKWPNVPACYGWLALDRRGRWRISGSLISHPGTLGFLNAHYASDDAGRWFVQNGPQRAYVDIELAPWILTVDPAGCLHTQIGDTVPFGDEVFVTEHGDLLQLTARGLAAVSDRDLVACAALLRAGDGEDALSVLAALTPGAEATLHRRDGTGCRARGVSEADLIARCGLVREPRA